MGIGLGLGYGIKWHLEQLKERMRTWGTHWEPYGKGSLKEYHFRMLKFAIRKFFLKATICESKDASRLGVRDFSVESPNTMLVI
jgi:hypothetical protein